MKHIIYFIVFFALLIFCHPSAVDISECVDQTHLKGFWYGIAHGATSLALFIWGLFNDSIKIYDVNNNGSWYDLGFMLGTGGIVSSVFGFTKSK